MLLMGVFKDYVALLPASDDVSGQCDVPEEGLPVPVIASATGQGEVVAVQIRVNMDLRAKHPDEHVHYGLAPAVLPEHAGEAPYLFKEVSTHDYATPA